MSNLSQADGVRILVVDDVPANVQLLVRMLGSRGYVAQPVLSGAEALAAARITAPDLILLDINMPGMDGFEVCQHLKADSQLRDIPVLFLSAQDDSLDKVRGFAVGGVDYVTKPFQLDEVFARIEMQLKLQRLHHQVLVHNKQLEKLVAMRTQELEAACLREQALSSIQGDFLSMISHEMRTPANGLLGLGELLIRLCPPSDALSRYTRMFSQSRSRLMGLLDDVSLISSSSAFAGEHSLACQWADVLKKLNDQLLQVLPGVQLRLTGPDAQSAVYLEGTHALYVRALGTAMQLALSFAQSTTVLHLVCRLDSQRLYLQLELDALSLSKAQAQDFFAVASPARAFSSAESLGLAPAVARHILCALGGDLQLVKGAGETGYLEATLKLAANPVAFVVEVA